MPHPWKHSRSGWTGLWATCSSWRCPCSLQGGWTRWPLKVPSNPNYSMILFCGSLLFQFVTVVSPDAQLNKELEFLSHLFCSFLTRAVYWEDTGYNLCKGAVRCVSHSSFISSQESLGVVPTWFCSSITVQTSSLYRSGWEKNWGQFNLQSYECLTPQSNS